MPAKIYLPAKAGIFNRTFRIAEFGTEMWFALVTTGSTFMDDEPATMDAFVDLAQVGVDVNLGGISVFQELAKDRVYIPTTAVSATYSLEPVDGPILGGVLYWKITDYTDSIPMAAFELGVPHKVRTAESYSFPFPSDGLIEILNFGDRAYLAGRAILLEGYKEFTTGFRMALVKSGSNYLSGNPAVLSDITNLNEFGGVGYARQDITFTVNTDTVKGRAYLDTPDVNFGVLADDDAPIVGVVIFHPAAINSVADRVFFGMRLTQPVNPGGAAYTFPFPTDGIWL